MTKLARIAISRRLPEPVERRAAETFDARLNTDDHALAGDALVAHALGCDGLVVAPTERVDAELIGRLPASVRIVATYSVGYDHVDVLAAAARGIVVTNTPDVLTEATADVAMLCLLGAARRAQSAYRAMVAGRWQRWTPTEFLGDDLAGRTLGIYGMGRIGRGVARRARGFGLEVLYHDLQRLDPALEEGARHVADIDELLAAVDFLSLHAPAGPHTRGFVDAARLARMKRGVVIVNTARGALVDDDALIAALRSGQVGAAGFDVYNNEPALHPDYLTLDNVFLLPHIGSATVGTRIAMGMRALDNVEAFFRSGAPRDRVSP